MSEAAEANVNLTASDLDRFRLRNFVERLREVGELDVVDRPVDLLDLAAHLDGNPKAVLFKAAGSERAEIVGNVVGARSRLALAFDVSEGELLQETIRRLATPIPPIVVDRTRAPVQQIVLEGEDADLLSLPAHLQHGFDGGLYLSATIDVSASGDGAKRNIGYRRLMVRGRHTAGVDMLAPSDLRAAYMKLAAEGKPMPIAFVIGSHPLDSVAAVSMAPLDDEFAVMGALRGQAVPLVKCVTNDLFVPADAEYVLEGYLDDKGWYEPEGPFGEYLGYYGGMKTNPVFHLTAITRRDDAVFQTATISGRHLGSTDTAQLCALRTEVTAWSAIQSAIREPKAVFCPPAAGGMFNLRVAIRQRSPGEARNAIAAIHGSHADVKNVFVVDEDIDVFSDQQIEWALATRFQPDRDLVVASGLRTMPLDPSLHGSRSGSKAGFDLTFPFGSADTQEFRVPAPPVVTEAQAMSIAQALESGPKYFLELMALAGSRDGRDVTRELDGLRRSGLTRDPDGRYAIRN